MKAHSYYQKAIRLIVSLVVVFSFVPILAQDNHQHALYNYRNDGNFNAWLNIDIDSITYSRIDTLGVEHDDVVVQEVWTPDSVYRIPLEVIDSIGFRAPAPEFRDGLFYLRDYHASNTYAKDSLTIYFSPVILRDSLPAVGQTIVSMTDLSPYEHGFAGKVVGITYNQDHIKVECTNAQINDIFKHFVFVGKVVGNEDSVSVPSEMKKAKGLEYNLPVKTYKLPDINLSILNGILSVNSVKPKVTCYCIAYVDALFYQISADAFISHDDISYTIKVNDDIIRRLDTETYGLLYELMTNDPFDKETAEEMEDKLLEVEWKEKIPLLDIPLGPVRLSIDFVPSLKMSGNVEASYQYSTKIKQHIGFETKNITMASMAALSSPGVAPFLLAADAFKNTTHTFVEDKSAANHKIGLTLDGSFSVGAALKLSVCLWADGVAHASVGGEGGLKMKGTIDFNLDTKDFDDNEEDMYNYPLWYGLTKDTKAEAELYAKVTGEIGITPSKFLKLKGSIEPESWKKDLGTLYLFPHFTKPALPQSYEQGEWEYSPLTMKSIPSNDLLFSSNLGMVITDNMKDNRLFYTPAEEEYKYEEEWKKANDGLSISISNLSPGTYYCYPAFCLWGNKLWKAGPYTKIEVPEPLSISTQNVNVGIGESKTIYYTGGWEIIKSRVDDNDRSVAEVTDGDGYIVITGKKKGTAHITVEDKRSHYSVVLTVKVSDTFSLTLSTSTLELTPGSEGTVDITSGSGSYDAVSNDKSVATVTVEGSKIIIKAVAAGTATITVKDNQTQERAKIEVTVSEGQSTITVSPTEIDFGSVEYGTAKTRELKVTNTGNKSLTFYVNYQGSKAFSINDIGREFTLGPGDFKPYTVTCNGMQSGESANGEIHVVTTPDNNIQKVPVKASGNGHISLILEKTSIEIEVDESAKIKILQGSGSYNLSNSAPEIVDASLSQTNGIPCISIKGLKAGTSVIQIKDSSTGDTKTLAVTVVFVPSTWAIDIAEISFGTVPLGKTKTAEFNVINTGDRKLTFKISTNTSPFIISNAGVTITLAKGEMQAFTVTCNGLRFGTEASVWVPIEADASNYGEFSGVGISANGGKLSYVPAEAIDLGLPSGTKWASYNVGAAAPDEYGGSYAWGETDIKDSYSWSNYKYCYGSAETCINIGDDISGTKYDVATQKWGKEWQMPTSTQFSELEANCSWEWTTQNGITGQKVTGPNGNSIFLPAVGSGYEDGEGVGSTGYYWTSNLYDSSLAHDFIYYMDFLSYIGKHDRCNAHAVRPVKPAQETPSEGIDLGLPSGTKWASHNVGAAKPEDIGGYYAWGETKTKSSYSWGNYTHCDGSEETCHDIGSNISGTEYDVAFLKWGEEWQMPTRDQCRELRDNCTIEHTNISGVDGYRFTGPNGNSIFLPVAENMPNGMGHAYWSSTASGIKSAYTLRLLDSKASTTGWSRYDGFSVRPVMKGALPTQPLISITPSEIDFGVVAYGTDETKTFTVNNTGNAPLTFTAYCDPYITFFEMADHGMEFTLEPGTSKNISVTCHGIKTGNKASTNIVVVSNAANSSIYVKLSVVGTDSEPLVEATSLNLFLGYQKTLAVRTENFAFSNSNPDIVSVIRGGSSTDSGAGELSDYNYHSLSSSSTGHIVVEALAVGQATVKVTDKDTGKETILTVTVTKNSSPAEAIDLGLPSGTRWASYNVGATKPEEFGGKYAWGETEVKEDYTEENYLYNGQNLGSIICGTEYDVAHVKWGGNWQMPTKKQIEELISKCTYEVVVVNGISGGKFIGPNGSSVFFPSEHIGRGESFWSGTSSDDESNAYVLDVQRGCGTIYNLSRYHGYCVRPVEVSNMIPPAITVIPEDIHFGVVKLGTDKSKALTVTNTGNASVTVTIDGCTNSYSNFDVSNNQEEVTLAPGESKVYTVTAHGTKAGYAPTQLLLVKCSGLEEAMEVGMSSYGDDDDPIIDVTELSLNVGETADVKVRNSGDYSSRPDVDNIVELGGGGGPGAHGGPIDRHEPFNNYSESEMTVKALKVGVAHITFTDHHTNHTSVLTITVTDGSTAEITAEAIDLGLPSGTKWASYNVGATKPEEYGSYFAWGETEEKDDYGWHTYIHCDGTRETLHDIGSNIQGTEYDVAHMKWGGNWVMPSNDEINELFTNCTIERTTLNGIKCLQFTGSNGRSIFLPDCDYWSSQLQTIVPETAYYWGSVTLDKMRVSKSQSRYAGKCIRPVLKPQSGTTDSGGDEV